jgi:DNA-binding winged helix-turn-helix (wHTH) protein/Tol biopolymer transport system component
MSKKTLTLYEFDEFRLDTEKKCLWHSDTLVSLTPKALETLLVLIKHRGDVVSKDDLLNEVWADTFVEESTLSQNILTLRKTLGAFHKDKQFIVTVPRRGFRFVAEVKEIVGDEAVFIVEKRTRTHIVSEQIHDSLEPAKIILQKTFLQRYAVFSAILIGAVMITAGVFALNYFFKPPNLVETKFQNFSTSNLFSSADIQRAIVSPNGKYLALIEQKGAETSLVLRQIAESNSLEIVPKFDGRFIGATFSPESDYVFYAVYPKDLRQGELYKIPILGGAPQLILKDIDSNVSISSDSKKLAFIRRFPNEKETAVMIADADGKNEQKLSVRKFGEGFQSAAFSPDGEFISASAFSTANPEKPMEIIFINTKNADQKLLTPQTWTWIGETVWLKDGSGIVFVAYTTISPDLTDEIWFLSFPEGKARLLENGINGVFGLSLTADSNSLAAVKSNKITSFAISSIDFANEEKSFLTKTGDESLMPLGADWTVDGKIVYSTITNGNSDIWTRNADGTEQKQLTSDKFADVAPKVFENTIYFMSNRTGLMSLWRMNADGVNQVQISENQDVASFDLLPDGREIFYTARTENIFTQRLWKMSADGKNARQLTEKATILPKVSPDGKTVACYFPDTASGQFKLTLLSAENGEIIRQIETPKSKGLGLFIWKDAQNLLILTHGNNTATIWLQPSDGTSAKNLKDWQNETIFRLAISKDGSKVFYEKGVTANNVVVLKDNSSGN